MVKSSLLLLGQSTSVRDGEGTSARADGAWFSWWAWWHAQGTGISTANRAETLGGREVLVRTGR